MNKTTARFSSKLLSWLLILAMILSLLPMSALAAEDKQTPPTQILKCETNWGTDFKLTFSSEASAWLSFIKSVTIANTSYAKVDYANSVWNNTNYYIGGDYLLIGEGFTGNSATCVIEAEGYSALTLTLDKTAHSAVIISAQEPETGGDSDNEKENPGQDIEKPSVTAPTFSQTTGFDTYYILTFSENNYVSDISNVLVNGQTCEKGSFASYIHGTQYYLNEADNKLYLASQASLANEETFKNGDIITIQNPSYQDLVLKVTIAGDTVNIAPDNGGGEDEYTLHVRLVGSFEAALVGQEDYDAVSGASTNVTTNKNSNVEVQGALIQGDEPVSSDWKPLNQLGITVNKNTTSVSISPDNSGMVGVYSTHNSSLTLAGTPEKAGSYKISVTVSDGQGRTATSNELPFNVYSGKETLAERLTLDNCTKTSDGKYMWDMEPWAISDFGGTDDTVTVPADLKAWYGSHTSGTYGKLGYAVANEAAPTQTLIVPDGCNLTMVNMDVLSSVKIVVQSGGKLVLRDSVIQGIVEVEDGGAFSMNYNDYGEGKFESGASINGQLILQDGATLENASIYSNTNNIANGNVARHNTSPVVVVNGNVSMKGNVFIRGDEAASGTDEATGKSYSGQPALQVNGTLTIPAGSILAAYGGGTKATTSVGGDAVILHNGTITGSGKLVAIGGDGEYGDGGDAVAGTGTISTREAFLQGGSTFMPKDGSAPGQAAADGVTVADTTKRVLKNGISYTDTKDNPNTPHWTGTEAPDAELLSKYSIVAATYVLMNIPYADFYAAEVDNGETPASVDAISSATKSKTMKSNLAAGSYHVNDNGTDITGVIYPVYVEDSSVLNDCTEVESEETLFCNNSYAYCELSDAPGSYKVLTVKDGAFKFGKATGTVSEDENASAVLSTDDHHVDYAITVKDLDGVDQSTVVSGVTLHTTDNKVYGLRHVYEIWRGTSLGFNISGENGDYASLVGKTIDKITYYLNDGKILTFATDLTVPTLAGVTATVTSVDAGTTSTSFTLSGALPENFNPAYRVNLDGATVDEASGTITLPANAAFGTYKLTIEDKNGTYAPITGRFSLYGYVLMNIPYGEFYAAEKNKDDTAANVDAVSSATKSKTRSTLAAGSYHVNSDGTDITGIIYPVQISDASVLNGFKKITDEDSITCTVKLRGQEVTTTYEGKDALFEQPSYSYYVLSETPDSYKTLNVRRGTKSFGAATGTAEVLSGASVTLSTDDRHVDVAIKITDESGTIKADNVSGVTLHTTDGNVYGLRHVYEIWRGTELGFDLTGDNGDYEALQGKTIDKITYYLNDGKIRTISVGLAVPTFTTTTVTVDGEDHEMLKASAVTFNDISKLNDKALFPNGANDTYLVTISGETNLLGDTTLKRWVGTWENWQDWIYPSEEMLARYPYLEQVWEKAYAAYIKAFEDAGMGDAIKEKFPDVKALKEYWYGMTDTKGVESIRVEEKDEDGYRLSWLDGRGKVLASDAYTMTGKVLTGLEGAVMYVFTADTLEDGNQYKYFVTMAPDMEGDEETPIAAHYHFQFGSNLNDILKNGALHNAIDKNETTGRAVSDMVDTKWYATMINANASDVAKYNVILGMHRADKFSANDDVLPDIPGESGGSSSGSSSSSSSNTATTKNPDGSTTTTTTDKKTGTVTETTKTTDGTIGTVVTNKDGDVTEVKATVSSAAVTEAAKSGEAVTLPVEVPTAMATKDAPSVEITLPKGTSSVKVEIPVENVTPGTVAVIVKADGTEEIVKTSVLTEDGVLLKLEGSATVKVIENAKYFSDTNGHWAEDAISFVTAREMFAGTSATTFTPNSQMTRAQLMTVLARFDGVDTNGGSVWYEKGMEWAKANGVSDGSNPNGSITREQLATMLWRYSGSPVVEGSLDRFNDAGKVSGYATDAMRWAVETGLIGGIGNNTLAPQGNATRAQLATILTRYCENLA